jgi:hypothetical protein
MPKSPASPTPDSNLVQPEYRRDGYRRIERDVLLEKGDSAPDGQRTAPRPEVPGDETEKCAFPGSVAPDETGAPECESRVEVLEDAGAVGMVVREAGQRDAREGRHECS